MIRKGRKPNPRNEEEMLQQIEERAASKLREYEHRNALKRAKRIAKLNVGPVLGAAKEPSEKKTKIQKKQLKPQDQQTSHQKPKSNVNSTPEGQEDSHDKFLEDIAQAPVEHSNASSNINPLESKGNDIQQLREKLKEEFIGS
ncbi:hypothetical protein OUZ56_010159 [Daphnia magna]|uniref:Uncharacterized protein n=1 Tax=Daphnia magna TaxID=35525 RepID=A0ABR0AHY5_9CRUS|nr:hypothetical protein OUZ56_010159 [Daphnia magna]